MGFASVLHQHRKHTLCKFPIKDNVIYSSRCTAEIALPQRAKQD
ncbi:hypothetical protein GCWU000325_00243 [Alloprevotella tannerae ATCC 51259]|uniref:Uncharacterized protein n=1 Tax=Alloprevotella tannerae ATCC 51259 TaxID=626522 RepID=C9LDH3_9BACT|nr:hypothetical protein GCWU000325_00243 [Alloprevotella tannerae ATCC 51259]